MNKSFDMSVKMIKIDEIDMKRPFEDRNLETTTKEMNALIASIEEYGLIHPITVYKKENGGYGLIAGKRRLVAYQTLSTLRHPGKFKEIPAFVVDKKELIDMAGILYSENNTRSEVGSTYEALSSLIAFYAAYFGISKDLVQNGVKLYRLFIKYNNLKNPITPETDEQLDEFGVDITSSDVLTKTYDFFDKFAIKKWRMDTAYNAVMLPEDIKRLFIDSIIDIKTAKKLHKLKESGVDIDPLLQRIYNEELSRNDILLMISEYAVAKKEEKSRAKKKIKKYLLVAQQIEKEVREFKKKVKKMSNINSIESAIEEFKQNLQKELIK